jgi:hypothetical protein
MTHLVPYLREMEKTGASGTVAGANEVFEAAASEYQRIKEFLKTRAELTSIMAENLIPA